jgi:hypothetical protein
MRCWVFLSAFALLILVNYGAQAQTFACGQSMVETGVGTTKGEVEATCGPPTKKTENRWFYENQPGQVTVVLTFENGTLQQIEQMPQE